jgi:hypothetical protein
MRCWSGSCCWLLAARTQHIACLLPLAAASAPQSYYYGSTKTLPACSALGRLHLDTTVVRTWRSASLLLRACWDAIPELRPLYAEFIDRLEDAIRRLSRCGVVCVSSAQLLCEPGCTQVDTGADACRLADRGGATHRLSGVARQCRAFQDGMTV